MNVSLFPKISQTTHPQNTPIGEVLQGIKNGKWQQQTQAYRDAVEMYGKRTPEAKALKKSAPYFTVSGTFTERSEEGLSDHSGFAALDLDDIPQDKLANIKGRIAASKYCYAVFDSIGGSGLCVIIPILPEEHSEVFPELEEYFARMYGVNIDYLADVSRARFVSYDPDLKHDSSAKTFEVGCETHTEQSPNGQVKTYWTDEEQIAFAQQWVNKKGIDFIEGQRHRFIFEMACMCNRLGVDMHTLEQWAGQFPHWRADPSNAITYPYTKYKTEFGTWKNEKKYSQRWEEQQEEAGTMSPEQDAAYNPVAKPFPRDVFPPELQDLIDSFEEANGFNPEFQAAAILSVFSAIAGNMMRVKVKEGWIEAPVFWAAMVGNPSAMKTPVSKNYMKPLNDLEGEWGRAYKQDMEDYEAEVAAAKEQKVSNAGIEQPTRREMLINDATMEAMLMIHANNPNGLLLFRDELLGWINSMNQYRSKGGDEQLWLSVYSNGTIKISRVSRGTLTVEKSFVSVLGSIQPAVLEELAKGNKSESGFTYRISFFYPESVEVPDWSEKEVDKKLVDLYETAVKTCVRDFSQMQEAGFPTLSLTGEARQLFAEWSNQNRQLLRVVKDAGREDIYKKLEGVCIRISAILQTIYYAYRYEACQAITPIAMRGAISIVEYLRHNSIKAHGMMNVPDDTAKRAGEMYQEGKSIREIADKLKVSKSKVGRWKKQNPDLFTRDQK